MIVKAAPAAEVTEEAPATEGKTKEELEVEKMKSRAARFGIPVAIPENDKLSARAARCDAFAITRKR